MSQPDRQPLRLHDPAPGFTARTTHGERSLAGYRGRWLLFFSHPADFTPVCTSEFLALAEAAPAFASLDCELLALSVDSLYSHIAWLADIKERFAVTVPFPVIEDPSMVIARAYGMLDPESGDTATVRASYVIDPDGIVRAVVWYPMTVGRSVAELLRLVEALQTTDRHGGSTPEGWQPGQPLLAPTPTSVAAAAAKPGRDECWYFREQRR